MATYYKFKERDKQERIDWGGIAKEFSDDIQAERQRRAKLKSEHTAQEAKMQAELSQYDAMSNETLNETALKASQEAKKYIKSRYDAMRRGEISPDDWALAQQSISDDFTNFKSVAQGLDKAYQELGDGTEGNTFLAEYLSKNLDISKGNIVPGPDGRLVLQVKDEEGNVRNTPIRSLQKHMTERWDNYDVDVSKLTKELGTYEQTVGTYGKQETVKANEAYGNWLESQQDNLIASGPQKISSVLTEFGAYELTSDKSQAGVNKIYVERDASGKMIPQLTDEMKEEARDLLKTQIEIRLNRKFDDGKLKENEMRAKNTALSLRMQEASRAQGKEKEEIEAATSLSKDVRKLLHEKNVQGLANMRYGKERMPIDGGSIQIFHGDQPTGKGGKKITYIKFNTVDTSKTGEGDDEYLTFPHEIQVDNDEGLQQFVRELYEGRGIKMTQSAFEAIREDVLGAKGPQKKPNVQELIKKYSK